MYAFLPVIAALPLGTASPFTASVLACMVPQLVVAGINIEKSRVRGA